MPDVGSSMRGRNGIVALVDECVRQPPGAERPVTVLIGPRGSGASEVHIALMDRFGRTTPFAYLNFASDEVLLPRYALALLARQLERIVPDHRANRFPRLTIGLLASDHELHMANRGEGRRTIRTLLQQHLRRTEARYGDYLGAFIEVAGNALGLPSGTPAVVTALARDAAGRGRRLPGPQFTRGLSWYADHPLVRCQDPWDALVELNLWRHSGDDSDKDALDRVLYAAFLADLRHNASRLLAARSFLVLLDDCHTDAGQRFLDLLVRSRHDEVLAGTPCDPLVVVAGTHRWLANWGSSTGEQWPWTVRGPDRVSLADWREHRPGHEGYDSWWYPVGLRDLTLDEVRTRIEVASRRHFDLAPFVHRLTCGLPRAVDSVLDVLAPSRAPLDDAAQRSRWLRTLLDEEVRAPLDAPRPPAPDDRRTLADLELDHLLEDFTREQRDTLARCAAARDLSVGTLVLGGTAAGRAGESLFNEVRARWLLLGPAGVAPRLHPWLRRLLLWRLARRPQEWDEAHGLLADHFDRQGAAVDAMYHRLAGGHVDDVVASLVERFRSQDAARWISDFNAVTGAPNRLPRGREPLALLGDLAPQRVEEAVTASSVIRGLVVARWVWSDPLSDPGMRLNDVIAGKFHHLSELRGSDIVALYDEADRYRNWRHPLTCSDGW